MARPTKAVATMSKNLTAEEKTARIKGEKVLKGEDDKLIPPTYLNEKQANIFKYIVDSLNKSGILGNLDIFILATCCIAIDRLQYIEIMINNDTDLLSNNAFMSSKEKYTKDLYRCCNELSLSPQSRAKLANINTQQKEENPLLKALIDDDD